ncbi:MAG: endonuclease domain-containing protein [Archangium sp.]
MWNSVRRRALGYAFRRQHQLGPWIADFACPERHLVIELDGSGHASPDKLERDRRRTEWLRQHGWTVLRFWNNDVLHETEAVLETVRTALLAPLPGPLPASHGEGVSAFSGTSSAAPSAATSLPSAR